MSCIQRYEPWSQEWPQEDANGDLVTYEDHRKVVEALEAKVARLIAAFRIGMMKAHDDYTHDAFDKLIAELMGESHD